MIHFHFNLCFLKLVKWYFFFIFFKGNETVCENDKMTLTCQTGIIFIEKAMYGRTEDERVCPHVSILNTNCTSTKSENIVKETCNGKSECIIPVKFNDDPCPNTYKYLEVTFICIWIAEHTHKTIECILFLCFLCNF